MCSSVKLINDRHGRKVYKKTMQQIHRPSTNTSFYRLRQANLYQYSTERLVLNIELARPFTRLSRGGVSRQFDANPVMGYVKPPNCPSPLPVCFHQKFCKQLDYLSRFSPFSAISDVFRLQDGTSARRSGDLAPEGPGSAEI